MFSSAQQWVIACGLQQLQDQVGVKELNNKGICSLHFSKNHYKKNGRLKVNAVPDTFGKKNVFMVNHFYCCNIYIEIGILFLLARLSICPR